MEFVDMNETDCKGRIFMMMGEWELSWIQTKGLEKSVGCQPYCVKHLSEQFEWKHYTKNTIITLSGI